MQNEFSLIDRYFSDIGAKQSSTILSQGDDAAVIAVPAGQQLVMSIDTLIAGVHFPDQTKPADIAHKALAVNLSDLAAMAATPACFLLSISLPEFDDGWLSEFSMSLKKLADQYRIELIGGDTCKGPLSITVQVNGLVGKDQYITRSGAKPGDLIIVSGQLGTAALGLAHSRGDISLPEPLKTKCINALNRPEPRLCLTGFLHQCATSAIDISDGLVGDLGHIVDKSGVGAKVYQHRLPVDDWISTNALFDYALTGGDDYELCFTIPQKYQNKLEHWNQQNEECPLTIIGEIIEAGYYLTDKSREIDLQTLSGFQHFV